MFVGLTNTPRDYAWGSTTAIAELLDRQPSGGPEAEYWLGTHPGSPSVVIDEEAGTRVLSELTQLPFILKVLAADTPVSLQAHPSAGQAEAGFARENALGLALTDPNRNYSDPRHKPELIYALGENLEALCGFRPVEATRALLEQLAEDRLVADFRDRLVDDSSLPAVFEWLASMGAGVPELLARVVECATGRPEPEFETVVSLAGLYPGDAGILVSLLLNRVTVRPGEVVFLPAGNIHSYLHGLGIEVLASSDNVLRGGLTRKRVDVPELLDVLDFRPLPVPFLAPTKPVPGLTLFRPDVPDFELAVVQPALAPSGSVRFQPASDFVALVTGGPVRVVRGLETRQLARGEAMFGTLEDSPLVVSGDGIVFIAATNPHP